MRERKNEGLCGGRSFHFRLSMAMAAHQLPGSNLPPFCLRTALSRSPPRPLSRKPSPTQPLSLQSPRQHSHPTSPRILNSSAARASSIPAPASGTEHKTQTNGASSRCTSLFPRYVYPSHWEDPGYISSQVISKCIISELDSTNAGPQRTSKLGNHKKLITHSLLPRSTRPHPHPRLPLKYQHL